MYTIIYARELIEILIVSCSILNSNITNNEKFKFLHNFL